MYKILIADDEEKIRAVIREYAEFEGYQVDEAIDGVEAVNKSLANEYNLIIMDVMMPKLDGFSASKKIKSKKNTPILMLSARGEEYDKLFGFEIGIDDYVVKPFSPKELMARVNVIIKRNLSNKVETTNILRFPNLEINCDARDVFVQGNKITLNPKEYDLLLYFINNRNIALNRDKILNAVWGYDFFGNGRTVDTHVKMLRNNLGCCRDYIVTIHGIGYKFEVSEGNNEI